MKCVGERRWEISGPGGLEEISKVINRALFFSESKGETLSLNYYKFVYYMLSFVVRIFKFARCFILQMSHEEVTINTQDTVF